MTTAKAFRETKQRNAIRVVLDDAARPLSPQEVLDLASASVPGIGIATVYRNIKTMVEAGDLVTVNIPGQPPRFVLPAHRKAHVFLDTETDRAYMFDLDLPGLRRKFPRFLKAETITLFCTGTTRAKSK